ncbi:unnamed protein product [Rotaria sp. Silwood1]|nr:unnamed protein product [Rotaria sp. Silwood1]
MSDYINSSSTRERTHAAKEADRQAAESSKYVPKVTIENPNRNHCFNMSDYINSSSTRERTHAAKEADRQAAESSKYVPKVTIENPNRSVPAEIKNRDHSINNTDRSVKVPIFYSTISVASAFITVTVIFCVCIFVPPVPQAQSYHNFADRRSLRQLIPSLSFINIPNALDVLSNIPFLIVGLYGLYLLLTPKTIVFLTSFEKFRWIIFFISISFVCVGSAYYHLRPYNSTLVWDRLPKYSKCS